jgi:hypothetical protein
MDQATFEATFQQWQLAYLDDNATYPEDLWTQIGEHPLDLRLTELADLYLSANPDQRMAIYQDFRDDEPRLWELLVYVRRMAKMLATPADSRWLRRGLAIAAVEGVGCDFRDSIISLIILSWGAERAQIDTRPYFIEIIAIAPREARDVFRNAKSHHRAAMAATLQVFGPRDWIAEGRT